MRFNGVAHVSLTVSDLERSREWYGRVFGWQCVMEGAGEGAKFAVGAVPGAPLVGLQEHAATGSELFDPNRVGLDHLALAVDSPEELDSWEHRLTDLGVTHDAVEHTPYGHVLNLKDPDGIALEIFADL
jgi:catechol-2,3-dioxygenase